MRNILFMVLMSVITSCTPAPAPAGKAATVILDVSAILQRSPDIIRLRTDEGDFISRRNKTVEEAQKVQREMRDELEKIADKTTLSYRNKESSYRRRLEEYTKKLDAMQLTMARKFTSTTDKAYRAMMDAALKVARRRGASIVLPRKELPDPHFELQSGENVVKLMRAYEMALSERVVVAATEGADITAAVLKELGW